LLVLAVMSFTVVNSVRSKNDELTKALDTSLYEAGRLLSSAQADYVSTDYARAETTLRTLLEKQPGSPEAVEGKELLAEVVSAQAESDKRWATEMPAIEKAWSAKLIADLRAKSDLARTELENGLPDTVSKAWDQAKEQIRADWEKQLKAES
jgi:hypothetical protein